MKNQPPIIWIEQRKAKRENQIFIIGLIKKQEFSCRNRRRNN